MVALIAGLVLVGVLALALMRSTTASGVTLPTAAFGAPRSVHRVVALSAIRPAERAPIPQGSLGTGQLLPAPATPVWATIPRHARVMLTAHIAAAGMASQLDRARAAAQAGSRDEALRLYDAIAGRVPADRALVIEQAGVLASFGEHRRAAAVLRTSLARFPDDYELEMLAARNAWWSEQPVEADSLVGHALTLRPRDAAATRLRETIRTTTQPPLAIARQWALESGASRENLLLARALVRDGSFASSLSPYRVALGDPRFRTDSLLLEAAAAAAAADSLAVLAALTDQYLILHPNDAAAVLRVARAYSSRGDYGEAMRHYDRLDLSDPSIRLEVAQVLVWDKHETRAQTELLTVLDARPHDATALKLLGDLSLRRGDYATAQDFYGQAFTVDPSVEGLGAGQLAAAAGLEQARTGPQRRATPNGIAATFDGFGDSQGFRWLSTRATNAFRTAGASFVASVGQTVYQGSPVAAPGSRSGAGLQVDGAFDVWQGMRVTAMAGAETYAGVSSFALFGAGLTVFDMRGLQVGLDYRHQPAVSRAATLAALQARATSDVLAVSFASTRGAWSTSAHLENERVTSSVGGANRVAAIASLTRVLTPALSATIGVSALGVDRASPVLPGFGNVLWAPSSYVEPRLALAYRSTLTPHLSLTAGGQLGYGFASERPGDHRYDGGAFPTGVLSGDLSYEGGAWTMSAGGSYGGALARGYRTALVRIRATYRLGQ
jgi:tetratricopeptide (TPR) repeat protein